ncbi:MAG: hypothetical protein K2J16_01560 [Clostridia bacterium]|nr:hypothetical protein [Clostridia bacterium]
MDLKLQKIVNDYMNDFESKKYSSVAVRNSIPIIWFGDMEAYQKSDKKILTIGLNPSLREFPAYGRPRFNLNANNADALYKTLNNYFIDNPYDNWFNNFERCLNRIDTSFGGKMSSAHFSNTAIHIDVFSSIATNPTWGRLSDFEKDEVNQQELFQDLLDYLNPDIILMSVANECFMNTLNIRNPIKIFYRHRKVEVYDENGRIMIYGRNMKGQPFGGIDAKDLDLAFAKVKSIM